MASVRPDSNKSHDLGTSSVKWGTTHTGDVQTETLTASGDVTVEGNLTVTGSQIIATVQTVEATDPLIKLAKDNTGDALDIGFYGKIVDGVTTEYVGLYRDASDGKFKLFDNATSEPSTTVSGGSTATLVANVEGDITGNAGSADQLSTARTISLSGDVAGSVSFDGSANVDIASTIQASSVENSMLANAGITFGDGTSSESIELGQTLTIEGTTDEATVSYDAANNKFVIGLPSDVVIANDLTVTGTITGSVNANSATASELETARTIALSGDLGGSTSFDGSQDVTINATIQAGSVENTMLVNDGISLKVDGVAQEDINLGDALDIVSGQDIDVSYSTSTNELTIALEATIDSDTTGNAATATALETSRTLSVSGDASGSVAFDGTANADIDLTIATGAVENTMLANDGWSLKLNGVSQEDVDLGGELNFAGTSSEVEVSYDSGTNTLTFGLPSTIVAALSGNASTASAWQTSRTISLGGDLGGSVSIDGSADATLTATIQAGSVENSMLDNSSITISDGSTTSSIALGGTHTIQGTANEVEVAHSAGTTTVGLPSSISGLSSISATSFSGALTGDVTGNADTASALETSRTIALSGDVTGSGSFDGSANLTISTTLAGGTALTFSDGTNSEALSLGSTLTIEGTSNEVDVAYDSANDKFTVGLPSTITADVSGNASTASALQTSRTIALAGDVTGSVGFDGSGNVSITTSLDAGGLITVGDGTSSEELQVGDSISIQGTSNEVEVAYSTSTNQFTVGLPSTISGLTSVSSTGFTGDLTGKADTADALETARTISLSGDVSGSVSFDGSANADIAATIQSGAVENSMLANSTLTISDDNANAGTIALGDSLKFSQTANETTVEYDSGAGIITVGLESTINADTTGNAATATALATARNIGITSGPVQAANVSFDGSGNVALTSSIADDQITNAMLANDKLVINVDSVDYDRPLGSTLTFSALGDATVSYSASTNEIEIGTAATLTSDTTGNAATATALETARTLSISGDATGSASFDGTANTDIALTIASGAVDNSMLANDGWGLQVGGVAQEDINLGDNLNFVAGQDIDIAYNSTLNALTVSLEGTIDSDTTGNAATASQLQTARTISLSGDVAGSVSFNGSGNVDITSTIQSGSVENAMLVNSSINVSDGSNNENIALGGGFEIVGTSNETEVSYSALNNRFTVGLPDDVTVGSDLTVTDKLTVNGGSGIEVVNGPLNVISGSGATISGTTTINGTLIANSATMRFQDTIVEFGYTNTSAVDHGFHSKHSDGDFVGMVYDESDGEFVLFKTGDKPNTTLDRAAGTYETADLQVGGLNVEDKLILDSDELTISTGSITATRSRHTVDTEGDASTDDLTSIGGGVDGQILLLSSADSARTVVVKSTGNIATPGGTDFSLDNTADTIMLMYVGALSKWVTISSSNNA